MNVTRRGRAAGENGYGVVLVGAALTAAVCATACRSREALVLDLVQSFEQAELRSDTLNLPFLLTRKDLPRRGWQEPRPGATPLWSRWSTATLTLPFDSTASKELHFKARCHAELGPTLPLALVLNGHGLGTVELTAQEREFRLKVPRAVQVDGPNSLAFTVPRTGTPVITRGRRAPPSLALTALATRPTDGPASRGGPPRREPGRLVLPPGSSVAFVLRPPAGAELRWALRSATAGGGRLHVGLQTEEQQRTLFDEQVSNERRVRVPLELAPDRFARLTLANRGTATLRLTALEQRAPAAPSGRVRRARLGQKANVVMFLVDTLRADALGAYGRQAPTSPHFDAFAREAVLFDDAWAQAPWTRPAVASIFTGLSVGSHGVGRFSRALPETAETLAEHLQQAGYRSAGFVANHVVNARFGFAQGFDNWNDGATELYGASAQRLVERALRWLDSSSQPFFLYVHTLEPHTPYAPAPEDWRPFRPPGPQHDVEALLKQPRRTPEELRYVRSAYDGEVRANDRAFGLLLDGLRRRDRLDDTLVIFVADHGEEFQDHGALGHGHTLYQEQLRVPLAVRFPGAAGGGRRVAQVVQQIDLLPSLLALLDVPVPADVEGRDLSLLWRQGDAQPQEPGFVSEALFSDTRKSAFRFGFLKLIVNEDEPRLWRAGTPWELYDLARDPGEQHNLITRRPLAGRYLWGLFQTRRGLQARLQARWQGGREVTLSREDIEQLRGLGYIE